MVRPRYGAKLSVFRHIRTLCDWPRGLIYAGRSRAAERDQVHAEARLALSTIRRTVDGVTRDRDDFIDEISRRLQVDRVVQIVGTPGPGKSALLARYAIIAADCRSVLALRADAMTAGAVRLGIGRSAWLGDDVRARGID